MAVKPNGCDTTIFQPSNTNTQGPDHPHPEWGALAYRVPASELFLCRHTKGVRWRSASDVLRLSHGCGKQQRWRLFYELFLLREWLWTNKDNLQIFSAWKGSYCSHIVEPKHNKGRQRPPLSPTKIYQIFVLITQTTQTSWATPFFSKTTFRPSHVTRKSSFWPSVLAVLANSVPSFFVERKIRNNKQWTICRQKLDWKCHVYQLACLCHLRFQKAIKLQSMLEPSGQRKPTKKGWCGGIGGKCLILGHAKTLVHSGSWRLIKEPY